jgi:hypothetical protein
MEKDKTRAGYIEERLVRWSTTGNITMLWRGAFQCYSALARHDGVATIMANKVDLRLYSSAWYSTDRSSNLDSLYHTRRSPWGNEHLRSQGLVETMRTNSFNDDYLTEGVESG